MSGLKEVCHKMYLRSRLSSQSTHVLVAFITFSLASGVLGGVIFYIDSVGPEIVLDFTEDVVIDMEVHVLSAIHDQENITLQDIENTITEQRGVLAAEPIIKLRVNDFSNEKFVDVILGVDESLYEMFPNAIKTNASQYPVDNHTCLVQSQRMIELGLEVGDNYTIEVPTNYGSINQSLVIIGTFRSNLFVETGSVGRSSYSSLRVMMSREGILDAFLPLGYGRWGQLENHFWVDIDENYFIQGDLSQVDYNLNQVRKQIEQVSLPYAWVGNDFQILENIMLYSNWAFSMRIIALSFSIPSMVMGIMLVQYDSKLLEEEKRRDIGTLKIRGASGSQALKWVLSSASLTAGIGSLGALAFGTLAGVLSGSVRTFLEFSTTALAEFTLVISLDAILLVFLYSFSLGILVALPPAIKALIMTASEAHSKIDSESLLNKEQLGNPAIEIIALGLSVAILSPLMQILSYASNYGLSVFSFVAAISPLLLILILSLTRLLSRPSSFLKAAFLRIFAAKSIATGSRILSRNIRMFKKSEAMSIMFIAMVFCSGFFASISAATGEGHMKNLISYEVGADIVVSSISDFDNITINLADNITQVEGVANVGSLYQTKAQVGYWTTGFWGDRLYINTTYTLFAVQSNEWSDTAFLLDYFTNNNTPTNSISQLFNSSNVISSAKPIDHYESSLAGDIVPVYSDTFDVIVNGPSWVNKSKSPVIDVMAEFDGIEYGDAYFPGIPTASRFLMMDLDYIHTCENHTRVDKFYLRLEAGANYTQIVESIRAIAPSSWSSIDSSLKRIDAAFDTRAGQVIFGVYTLNALFSILYLSAGMIMVTVMKITKLRKQISILRALGTSDRSIRVPLVIDAVAGIVIALLIGGLLGFILTNFLIQFPLVYYGPDTVSRWNVLPVSLHFPFIILIGIVTLSFLFTLGANNIIINKTLKRNIADDIKSTD
ncbi:MAG: FtsX-like permease family protein [Candidatus Thorarchaeota archaeon]